VLVKPQFEVGRDQVGKGGIVTNPEFHRSAIEGVEMAFKQVDRTMTGVVASPIRGAEGNREFLAWFRADGSAADHAAIAEALETP
jgi:23S rRNA (cytidine1920-2'-O)/16S rRNA (cytidine1409-2'-O)-methyltransferase